MASSSVIDFLDVTIPLPAASVPLFEAWLERFEHEYTQIERPPRIKDNQLLMNSSDLIAFTGYIDASVWNELQLHGFKEAAKQAFEQLLLRTTSVDHRSHYTWCITALNTFEFGRFLREAS